MILKKEKDKKKFEDEFMNVQSGLVALCMEALEIAKQKVNKVYIYCSIEKDCLAFNTFFKVGTEVKTLNEVVKDMGLIMKILQMGTYDLEKVDNICKKYKMPIPREMKLCYNVDTGGFEAQYKYEEVCPASSDIDSDDIFEEWMEEIKEAQ